MKHPVLQYESKQVIDHVATGFLARAYRARTNVTQTALAKALRMSNTMLNHCEFGRRGWNAALLKRYLTTVDKLSA